MLFYSPHEKVDIIVSRLDLNLTDNLAIMVLFSKWMMFCKIIICLYNVFLFNFSLLTC
jgi:hypothetical protein